MQLEGVVTGHYMAFSDARETFGRACQEFLDPYPGRLLQWVWICMGMTSFAATRGRRVKTNKRGKQVRLNRTRKLKKIFVLSGHFFNCTQTTTRP